VSYQFLGWPHDQAADRARRFPHDDDDKPTGISRSRNFRPHTRFLVIPGLRGPTGASSFAGQRVARSFSTCGGSSCRHARPNWFAFLLTGPNGWIWWT